MDEPGGRDRIRSVERCFAVLLAFDADRPRPSLAELASATGLSRPAVRRILLTLQHLGYVTSTGPRWSLTPRVRTIGQHYTASHALIEAAQPHLLALAERTGESASLAEMDGDEVVYVARVPVRRIMSITVAVGTRVPAHATSMGRVLLAWATPDRVAEALRPELLARLTGRTTVDPQALRDELARVREQGFSIVSGELEAGLISASVPVRVRGGRVVAALASSPSAGRATPERLRDDVVPVLTGTAEAIGSELV